MTAEHTIALEIGKVTLEKCIAQSRCTELEQVLNTILSLKDEPAELANYLTQVGESYEKQSVQSGLQSSS